MRTQKQWTKWLVVAAVAMVSGACDTQAPTAVEAVPSPATASFATATTSTTSIAKLLVFPGTYTLKLGQYRQFLALPQTALGTTASLAGKTVVWSSSNPAVATVSATGVAVGRAGGQAIISATVDGVRGSAILTVDAPVSVASVSVTAPSSSVAVGSYLTFVATPKSSTGTPVSGYPVTWTSSNPAVAKVYSNGLVQGVSAGSATISATAGGKTGTAPITVTTVVAAPAPAPVPASPSGIVAVLVYPNSTALTVGQIKQLIALPRNAAGSTVSAPVTWSSSNTAVATVSASGLVTAKAAGSATITATAEGVKGTATINVSLPY